ncbi:MAG TPA: aminotransferase class IV [Vicinamibacteria bacterium]|nr:aminotransferase class IV [Vicinamibacteria bacterium]
MGEPKVATFEATPRGLVPLGRHASLALSSGQLPQGAYTTLRTYRGRAVVRLDQHLRRLEESVALQGQSGRIDPAEARRALASVLDATSHPESRLRLTFAPPRLFIAIEPFSPLPARLYEEGVACVTLDVRRENPHAKDTRFIAAAQDAYGHLPDGVEEGLLVDHDGTILEGLSSNFFAVWEGRLRTEEERSLRGVTRSLVLEVAGSLLPVDRRGIRRDEMERATEAFLTSVSREVLPVVRVDDRPVGAGRVGPKTQAILGGFAGLLRREAETL